MCYIGCGVSIRIDQNKGREKWKVPGGGIPHPDSRVQPTGGDTFPVKGNRVYLVYVPPENVDAFSCINIPYLTNKEGPMSSLYQRQRHDSPGRLCHSSRSRLGSHTRQDNGR